MPPGDVCCNDFNVADVCVTHKFIFLLDGGQ